MVKRIFLYIFYPQSRIFYFSGWAAAAWKRAASSYDCENEHKAKFSPGNCGWA
jgi:hypothetical protein